VKHWGWAPFGEVFDDVSGGHKKVPQSEVLPEGRYPVVDQGQGLIGGFVNDASRVCKVPLPAVVFGDHTRALKFIDFPFCMGADGTKVLVPKIIADIRYLYYYLRSVELTNAGYSRHFKFLKRISIPIPPPEEQRRIAAILEQADGIRATRRSAIAQVESLRETLYLDTVGKIRDTKFPMARLKEISDVITDGVHFKPEYLPFGVPFISVKNVATGKLKFDDCKYISHEAHTQYVRRCNPKFGDLLYTKVGTYGKAALVDTDREFSLYVSVCLIKPKKSLVNSVFLCSALNSNDVKRQANQRIRGIGVPDLHLDQIEQIQIPLPDIAVQLVFADRIKKIDSIMNSQYDSVAKLDALYQGLEYLAFRGDL